MAGLQGHAAIKLTIAFFSLAWWAVITVMTMVTVMPVMTSTQKQT